MRRSTGSNWRSGSVWMAPRVVPWMAGPGLSHDDLQGQPGRAAAADERGDLVPVDVVGHGFGERFRDPQFRQLPGAPVVNERLILVNGLVPALVHDLSPMRLDGDAAGF